MVNEKAGSLRELLARLERKMGPGMEVLIYEGDDQTPVLHGTFSEILGLHGNSPARRTIWRFEKA